MVMNWEDRIVSDPEVLVGKPTIRGTRLSVDFLRNALLTDGLRRSYSKITPALPLRTCVQSSPTLLKALKTDFLLRLPQLRNDSFLGE